MKPVTSSDIDDFLNRLKKSLDEEFNFLSNTRLIQKKYNDSIPMLINSCLSTYRNKGELSIDDISRLEQYNIDFSKGYYLVGVVNLGSDIDISASEEMKIFIGNLIDKVFKKEDIQNKLVPIFIQEDELNAACSDRLNY